MFAPVADALAIGVNMWSLLLLLAEDEVWLIGFLFFVLLFDGDELDDEDECSDGEDTLDVAVVLSLDDADE